MALSAGDGSDVAASTGTAITEAQPSSSESAVAISATVAAGDASSGAGTGISSVAASAAHGGAVASSAAPRSDVPASTASAITEAQPTASAVVPSAPDSAATLSATVAAGSSGADTDSAAAASAADSGAAAGSAVVDSGVASSAEPSAFEDMPGFKARRRVVVPGDDDCMCAAVAAAAGIKNAQLLRLAAVAFLRCHPQRVLPNAFDMTLEEWQHSTQAVPFHTAVQGFQSGGEPGACMMAVLATILGRPVTMFGRGLGSGGLQTCLPEGAAPESTWSAEELNPDHLAILYSGTHYDALVLDGAAAFDEATLTFARIIDYLPKDDPTRVAGTYSLRSNEPAPTTLLVRLCVHVA